jgi:hypothetical protein
MGIALFGDASDPFTDSRLGCRQDRAPFIASLLSNG